MQYQLLPDLDQEEYQRLKSDIANRGIQVPVEYDERGNILDGHHRIKIAQELGIKDYPSIIRPGLSEDEKIHHVLSLNLDRRHLSQDQRKELHLKLRQMGLSYRAIAEKTGVSKSTVLDDIAGVQNRTPDKIVGKDGKSYPAVFNKNKRDEQRSFNALADIPMDIIPNDVIDSKKAKYLQQEYLKQSRRDVIASQVADIPLDISIIHGDFREVMEDMPENSVDMIFTDPPYDRESVPLYGDLARLGARVLKPGGSLLAYAGHYALPEYFELMTPYLRYWWIIGIKHSGNSARLIGKNVFVEWKPILWFVKDSRGDNPQYVSDWFVSSQPEKIEHDWQQDISEAEYYVDHLTNPGDIILDPFMGSGTTLVASHKISRNSIGIENDINHVVRARSRIQSEC